jgi:hypothetical protein
MTELSWAEVVRLRVESDNARSFYANKLPRSKLWGIKRKNTAWVRSKLRGIAPCKGLK